MSKHRLVAVLIVVLVLAPVAGAWADNPPSTGTRVGTIIKDAIDVALPNVSKLIDAIFGTKTSAEKPAAQTAVQKQADASKVAANDKLKGISDVSAELSVVSQYLEQTVPASQRAVSLIARLDNVADGTMPNGVQSDWDTIKSHLSKLADIKTTDLNKVESGLRLQLVQVRGLYESNVDDVKAAIDQKHVSDLRTQIRAIGRLLDSVVAIGGIEITNLQQGLDGVVAAAGGVTPQGGSVASRTVAFQQVAADSIATAQRSLRNRSRQ